MTVGDFLPFVRLLPPVFLVGIALAVAHAPSYERANRRLALFLGVVAFGFALEFLWILLVGAYGYGTGPTYAARWVQFATSLVDPPLLLSYALIFPRERAAARNWALWGGYAVVALTLLLGIQLGVTYQFALANPWVNLASIVYTNGTYLAAFVLLLSSLRSTRQRFLRRQIQFVAFGVGFLALSRSAALVATGGPRWWASARIDASNLWHVPLMAALLSIVLAGSVLLGLRIAWHNLPAAHGRILTRLGILLVLFFAAWWGLGSLDHLLKNNGELFASIFGFRWIVFAGIAAYGLLRFQLFGFEARLHQAVALLVGSSVGFGAALFAGVSAQASGWTLTAARGLGLTVGAAMTAVAYVAIVRLARWMKPEADPGVARGRALEIYEATLEYALGRDVLDERETRLVETLRELLKISPEDHATIVGRLTQGVGPQARVPGTP